MNELDWLIKRELSGFNLKKWLRAYFAHGLSYFLKNNRRILPDYSGKLNIFIDPFGNVYPCDVSTHVIGNIKYLRNLESVNQNTECQKSWMICTARQAMRKHYARVLFWILLNKIRNVFR
jgi:MoaA/NifB/PqqE/SkfB family radical SAM enzyme